jgi:hypothetical protein
MSKFRNVLGHTQSIRVSIQYTHVNNVILDIPHQYLSITGHTLSNMKNISGHTY